MLELMFRILHFRHGDVNQNRQFEPPEAQIGSILEFLIERDQTCGIDHRFISVAAKSNGQAILNWLPSTTMRDCQTKAELATILMLKLEDVVSTDRAVSVNYTLSVNRFGNSATSRHDVSYYAQFVFIINKYDTRST